MTPEFIAAENAIPPHIARWLAYCRAAERALRVDDLNGDEAADGYSIDSAQDAYQAGVTAAQYAAGDRSASAWIKRAYRAPN